MQAGSAQQVTAGEAIDGRRGFGINGHGAGTGRAHLPTWQIRGFQELFTCERCLFKLLF